MKGNSFYKKCLQKPVNETTDEKEEDTGGHRTGRKQNENKESTDAFAQLAANSTDFKECLS